MGRFGSGAETIDGGTLFPSYAYENPLGPEYRSGEVNTAGAPTELADPYGPEYRPELLFFDQYKWWLIGGGIAAFVLAGGSILGLSLRRRRKKRR